MVFLQVLTLEFYADFAPLAWIIRGGGFLLDIATPARVWFHLEMSYATAAALALAVTGFLRIKRK